MKLEKMIELKINTDKPCKFWKQLPFMKKDSWKKCMNSVT